MTVVYGLGVWMEFPTTRRLSIVRDLSIRDGKTGWGDYDVGAISVLYTRRQMTVVYGPGVRLEFSTTCRLSMDRDLSIRDGKNGSGTDGGGVRSIWPIIP